MATVTGTTKDAVGYLIAYARRTKMRPTSLSPTDVANEIGSTAQVVGMAMEKILEELRLQGYKVKYERINNKCLITLLAVQS